MNFHQRSFKKQEFLSRKEGVESKAVYQQQMISNHKLEFLGDDKADQEQE